MKAALYNMKGSKAGEIELREDIFNIPWNADLVHQVVESERANQRRVLAHAKDRSEVSGGGKKPWRQKGTGRARHGSIRSPIWVKGGKAHGPKKERNFSKIIPKKMKRKALLAVLSQKARDKEVLFLDEVSLKEPKTKNAAAIVRELSGVKGFERLGEKGRKALVLEAKKDTALERAFRNLPYVDVGQARQIYPLQLMSYKYLVFPKMAVEVIEKTFSAFARKRK